MNKDLRKRLEEAAKKYQEEYETTERVAFTHGAVWGFKEAIKEAWKWFNKILEHYPELFNNELGEIQFHDHMNKLLEEEK